MSNTGVGRPGWPAGTAIYKVYGKCVYGAAKQPDRADNESGGAFRQVQPVLQNFDGVLDPRGWIVDDDDRADMSATIPFEPGE